MQSASASGGGVELRADLMWERVREAVGWGRLVSAVLVVALTLLVANSTSTAQWVDGTDVVVRIALFAAILMAVLALTPVPDGIALGAGAVSGFVVALYSAWPQMHLRHPTDTLGIGLAQVWWTRLTDGGAAADPSIYLFMIALLMWVSGAWLAWCVLRWRKPMLGLIPGAAAFATNVLNVRAGDTSQNGYAFWIAVFVMVLLLCANYSNSLHSAAVAHVKLAGDAGLDFWESGLIAMAGLLVLAIILPPLSTTDRTVDLESSMFSGWAQLQQELSHPGVFTNGPGGGGTTGFSTDVKLGGSLARTRDIVFTYTVVGDFAGPRYFRGVDETLTLDSEWRFPRNPGLRATFAKNEVIQFAEDYQKLAVAGVNVHMVRPPVGYTDILFYPGRLYKVDRPTVATQAPLAPAGIGLTTLDFNTIDRLSSQQPASSAGNYNPTVEYSLATASDLESAGTAYPDWVGPYASVPTDGSYRSPELLQRELDLARSIVARAGATDPYQEAAAIEAYLRDPQNFTYSLTVNTPAGTDPIEWFLFHSHKGYCEYFATSMGDMLRLLGIPTRLVNGYGPGSFDSTVNSFVVRGEDAHTWPEVYFPGFGWIPFEPTADGTYQPIPRGVAGANPCRLDQGCDNPGGAVGIPGLLASPLAGHGGRNDPASGPDTGGIGVGTLDSTVLTRIGAVVLVLVLVLVAVAVRYLRPRTVAAVWKRTVNLAHLAGAERRPGETPLELGRRLQRTFPEAATPVGSLTSGFVVAAYAPPDEATATRASVMDAWTELRPILLRRVFARFRPGRA